MKRITAIFILLVFLTGCTSKNNSYIEISFDDFKTKIENKESFPLLVGAKTCTACQLYKPTLEKVIKKYNLQIYYIDIETLKENESLDSYIVITGTPTLAFFTKGEEESIYNRINGNASSTETIKILQKKEYIKGD